MSHASAAVLHGAPTWGLRLDLVHVTHFSGGGRTGARVIHHEGECRVVDVTRANGHWLTTPARTALDVATERGAEVGIVVASDFLNRGLTSRDELIQLADTQTHWPNSLAHHVVLQVADGRFESVGEARTGHLFWRYHLPPPVPQREIRLPDGRLVAQVDFAWPELGVFAEFDGRIKYTRLRRPGESIEDAVLREKRREEMIVELTGWRVIRLTWADLESPDATIARVRRLLSRAA
ncbi:MULTISPECIES: hypothetical protein [unclassified Nocardioides]|uniref:hypothetical protein n=1 Tax=unclassified Nocardioides TaxID=2615069 RepID=UPI00361E48CE